MSIASKNLPMGSARFSALLVCAVFVPSAEAQAEDSVTLATPGMTGPLAGNPHPTTIDAGPLGTVYLTGAVSGLGMLQDHIFPGDEKSHLDLSNGQIFIQKVDGPLQFLVQAGLYSMPSLGTAYVKVGDITKETFGYVPQAFVRIVPSKNFNVMVGKLPTLAGAEYTFTFENMAINRGLLWNQENAVNRGVQANVSKGPLSVSLSLNDGFYSRKYNWLSGLVSFAASPKDTISAVAMGNVGHTSKTSFATPLAQNNGQIYNLIWTHNAGPWTLTPYLQVTHVPANRGLGIAKSASTYGGAVLTKYAVAPGFNLAGRAEYIKSSGGTNLIYGPGSSAWSLTITPTYQRKLFFVRAEAALVRAHGVVSGFGLGPDFDRRSQARFALESGLLF
jgi:hypothetical protein